MSLRDRMACPVKNAANADAIPVAAARAANDDQVAGGQGHLAHQVAGDEYGPALAGQGSQQGPDPYDTLRIQPVDRLVQQQHSRVAQQRGGDAQPLGHAQ